MKWRDVKVGDTVVSDATRTVCCLLARTGLMYTWIVLDAENDDMMQRPGNLFTTRADAHDDVIEGWAVFKGSKS